MAKKFLGENAVGQLVKWAIGKFASLSHKHTKSDITDFPVVITGGKQTATSTADGGENVYTFTDSAGKTSTLIVRNGTKGSKGDAGTPGKDGAPGADGQDGAAATITVGTVTTGAAGSAAAVKNSGTANAAVLDFTIPRGATGPQGAKGDTGATGPQGPTGATGTAGKNGTNGARGSRWSTGTAITGTSTTATAYATGITDALVNDMYLNTSTGLVYRCTVAGNASTAKWVYAGSIKGATGAAGSAGKNGTNGTNGTNGKDGAAATITVGTVTTGAAGSAAAVKNSGTANAATLDFTIPRGATGAKGTDGLTTKVAVGGTTFAHSNGTVTVTNAAVQKAVTPTAPTSGQVAIYDGTAGQMKSSGFTIATSVPAGAKFTDTNTDTKVTQTLVSDSANYPLLLAPKSQSANATTTACFDSGVYLNPSTNTIAANITGNAATANKLGSTPAGNTNTPVYFNAGVPTACGHNFSQYLPLAGGTMTGTINAKDIIPVTDNASVLGNKSKRWSYVYSEIAHFDGVAIGQELSAKGNGHIDFYRHDGTTMSPQGTIYASSTTDGLIVRPTTNNTGMVGTSSQKFAEINATNIYGAAISVVSGSGAKTTALPNRRTKALISMHTSTIYGSAYVTGLSTSMTARAGVLLYNSQSTTFGYSVSAKGEIITFVSDSTTVTWTIIYFN